MSTEQTAISASPEEPYAPLAGDEWAEDHDALPPRPRRRLLGKGGNPLQVALLGVLLLACGFIGGVLVEKGQTSSSASGAGGALASRFAALRGGGTGSDSGAGGSAASGSGGSTAGGAAAPGGGFAGRFGAGGGATIGEVAYISGSTLYVTNTEGDTVKVTTSPAASITKTVKTDVHGIHPGETVIVRGAKGSNGAVSAESVSVSTGAGASGGLGALFGGASGGGGARAATGGGGTGAAGGEPALFGK
jgi:hypothetical protein